MKALDRYLVKEFFPIFAASLAMFMLLVVLIDLFANLVRFLNSGAMIIEILKSTLYYLPKSLLYALPVALLFAVAYTLGDLYARNELSSMLCSGIPFWRLSVPFFVIGVFFSFFSFFFEDKIVIPALRLKNEMTRTILQTQTQEGNSDVVIRSEGGRLVYVADYYDWTRQMLNGLSIIEFSDDASFLSFARIPSARWIGSSWLFDNPYVYRFEDGFLRPGVLDNSERYNESPDTFRRGTIAASELSARDAAMLVQDLKNAGLSYVSALTDYHHRFSFSSVSFVVIFLSITLSGRFRKNILLMTLLASLGTAVVFYIIEMLTLMCARIGLLPPVLGAWAPVFFCLAAGLVLLRHART